MSWSLEFDEPITLAKGRSLRTLRDAADHVISLPGHESNQEHWQAAIESLVAAAEKGGIVMMARIAMVQALDTGKQAAPEPRKKPAKKYRIVS